MSWGSKYHILAVLLALSLVAVPALSVPSGYGDHCKGVGVGCCLNNSIGCQRAMMARVGDHGFGMGMDVRAHGMGGSGCIWGDLARTCLRMSPRRSWPSATREGALSLVGVSIIPWGKCLGLL